MKISRKVVSDLIEIIIEGGAVQATKYLSSNLIIRARRRLFSGEITKGNIELILTIGKPNYKEREFIKKCKMTDVPFPVKKIQIKWLKEVIKK